MNKKQKVAEAWIRGQVASTDNFFTDGQSLYSYSLKIGETLESKKIVFDYTSKGENYVTKTTSQHVQAARNAGAELWPVNR